MTKPKITTEDVNFSTEHIIDVSAPTIAEIDRPDLTVASENTSSNYYEDLDFMEQVVSFAVARTSDKNEPNPIQSGVNGEHKLIYRGVTYKLPRKFLNALINSTSSIDTEEFLDHNGLRQTRVITTTTPSLTIQYLPDGMPDPAGAKGVKWFANAYHGLA